MINKELIKIQHEIAESLRGKKCWHVGCGGAVSTTFSLALGRKIIRTIPIKNKKEPDDFQKYEGESNLYVWCTWRLDNAENPLTSSDDSINSISKILKRLQEKKITDVQIDMPGWDLHLTFTGGLILHIFCDHVPGDPSFDGNWEIWLKQKAYIFGPGAKYKVQNRS